MNRRLFYAVVLLGFLPLAARAAEAAAAWTPPVPPADTFDWIQLKSGEWLKGEIKGMENDQIKFDSKELDLHTFDMKDVSYIRSPRSFELLRSDRTVSTGTLEITKTTVTIGGLPFPRAEVRAFSAGGTSELQHWSADLAAGLIVRAGNTESADVNYQLAVQRATAATRLKFNFSGNISELDGVETANSQRASASFDKFQSARTFIRVPSAEYLQDQFQNIAHRITLGASYGYDFYRKTHLKWDATLGPAWQGTEFYSVQPGEDLKRDSFAVVLSSHFEADLTDRIEFSLDYRGQFTEKAVGETTHRAESVLSVDLTEQLELDLAVTWDHIKQPKADDSGILPEADDLRIAFNLSIKL